MLAGVIGICGGIPGDLDDNPRYSPFEGRTLYLYGDDDEFYTNEQFQSFDAKLAAKLPNYSSKKFSAKHEITEAMRAAVRDFLLS